MNALGARQSMAPGVILAGKFRVDRKLGAGGMGIVLAATHLVLERRVAIKLMLGNLAEDPELLARFLREGKAAARLQGDHVAKVLDVGRLDDGRPFHVMELLEGLDLSAHVAQRGALPVPDAVDYLLQACEAVAEAHAVGIVHRDLKPANLFLTKDLYGEPFVKVLDFGISKLIGLEFSTRPSLTKSSAVLGSPQYMSPEQIRSTRDVDGRTDIWALGCILYELVTGRAAFGGETVGEVVSKISADDSPDLRVTRPDLPHGLAAVAAKCLRKKAEDRYASVSELAAALLPFGGRSSKASVKRISHWDGVMRHPYSTDERSAVGAGAGAGAGLGLEPTLPLSAPEEPRKVQTGLVFTPSTQPQGGSHKVPAASEQRWRAPLGVASFAVLAAVIVGLGASGLFVWRGHRVTLQAEAGAPAVAATAASENANTVLPARGSTSPPAASDASALDASSIVPPKTVATGTSPAAPAATLAATGRAAGGSIGKPAADAKSAAALPSAPPATEPAVPPQPKPPQPSSTVPDWGGR